MTGRTVATMRWRALDREGEDTCRLARMDDGWMLIGHARFRTDGRWSALDYVVRCGADWLTRSADISGTHAGRDVSVRLHRDADGWLWEDRPQPRLAGAEDIDLGFTPATNLMPIRRLPEVGAITVRAAWLHDPAAPPEPLDQTYTRDRGGLVRYQSRQSGYDTSLKVDAHGFVALYPDLWEAVHAP